ncbi:MAG: class I SAM-dependent methyltransferase [Acidimicrobiales bacterium]
MASWWLDELRTAGTEHLDAAYVAAYDAKAQVDPSDDIDTLRRFGLDDASTVVDLGAGTGSFTVAAAPIARSVIAIDPSPAMLARLRQRLTDGAIGNVTTVEAGFLTYEHAGEPVDFVFTRNALHQLPDFWKVVALQRVATLLRPGGVLRLRDLVMDAAPAEVNTTVEAWMARAVDDPARGYTAAEFAEHLRLEFTTFTWLLEPMLERTGFEIVDREVRASIYADYTCRRR